MTTCACGNCQFFDTQSKSAAKSSPKHSGVCRFNPPTPNEEAGSNGLWPVVAEKDWCGHFAVTTERFMSAAE
jgi:hypothetical protein